MQKCETSERYISHGRSVIKSWWREGGAEGEQGRGIDRASAEGRGEMGAEQEIGAGEANSCET